MIKKLKDRIEASKKITSANQTGDIIKNQIIIMESLAYVIESLDLNKFDYNRKRK